jgi:hypothetical protein
MGAHARQFKLLRAGATRARELWEEFKRLRGAIGTRPDRIDERLDRSAVNRSG